jgi:hypothetical protein
MMSQIGFVIGIQKREQRATFIVDIVQDQLSYRDRPASPSLKLEVARRWSGALWKFNGYSEGRHLSFLSAGSSFLSVRRKKK